MNTVITHSRPVASGGDESGLATRASLLGRLRDLADNASWQVFFDTYWRLIFNVARRSGLTSDAAQEVVQETVIAVARRMPDFCYDPAKGSFKQWLLLITRRKINDHFRRHYRALSHADAMVVQSGESAGPAAPDAIIDAAWEEEWRENVFQMALARVRQSVNPKHYQVFDYCVLRDQRPRHVARMLGMSTAEVYLAKHRTIAAVKKAAAVIESEFSDR